MYTVWLSKTFIFQVIQFSQTVLNQTIQFRISMQFSSIWPIDRNLSEARVDLGVMAMNGCTTFPKAPILLEPHNQIFSVISRTFVGRWSYSSAEVQSMYSTAPANWAKNEWCLIELLGIHSNTWNHLTLLTYVYTS